MSRIYIFDTTLRDGEQSPGCSMTMPEKLQMAEALVDLGVDILEAGFPIASDGDFEAVDAVSRQFPWVQVAALARSCTGDVERAAKALQHAKRPRIHTFIATSDIHLEVQTSQKLASRCWTKPWPPSLSLAITPMMSSSQPKTPRAPIPLIWNKFAWQSSKPAPAPSISPTLSATPFPTNTPSLIGRMVNVLGDRAIVSVHCHDDLGLAVANSLAAVQAGARQVECTINGIGERAGNAALEEVVMAIKTRHDRLPFETGIHTEKIFPASQLLTRFITFGPQPNKAIVGENAFAHEAGIHQDGYLKNPATYEIFSPASVGVPESRLVLGQAQRPPRLEESRRRSGLHTHAKKNWTKSTRASRRWPTTKKACATTTFAALIEEVVRPQP